MKVNLINPPSPFLENERVFPYLGILSVATSLRKKGHNVEVTDFSGNKNWEIDLKTLPRTDIYGITSTTAQFKFAYKMGQILKGRGKTIIGGTHINNLPDNDFINQKDLEIFDEVFKGDGEGFLELDGTLNKNRIIKNLDDIEIPDRTFFDIKSYKYFLNGEPATTLLTQRGCPFKCVFCSGRNNDLYRKSRQHSPQRVVEEIKYLNQNFGFKGFMWFDDEMNIRPSRLEEIASRLKGSNFIHRGFLRTDLLIKHPETIKYLKDIGFIEVGIGIESGSNRILDLTKKGTNTEMNYEAVRLLKENGIKVKTFTIIGHPSETYEDIEATKNFLIKAKPDAFDISMMQPYPGSELYNDSKHSNKYPGFDFEYKGLYFSKPRFSQESLWHKGIPGMYHAVVRTDELTPRILVQLQNKLENEVHKKI